MALKKATNVLFTDSDGFEKTYELLVKAVNFDYQAATIEIVYQGQFSDEATASGIPPRGFRQVFTVDVGDANILTLLLSVSNKLWEMNLDKPFVMDFSEIQNNRVSPKLRTLNELGAVVEDVLTAFAKK